MKLVLTFEIDGEAERFIAEEWPLMLNGLYAQPQSAVLEAPGGDYGLSTALPDTEDEVKP